MLTQLFGTESVGAIAPMLTNLDLLKKNFLAVGKGGQFAGSMEQEYASRSATTANAIQLLQNRVSRLGITVGAILLPPINDALEVIGPWLSQLSGLVAEHPEFIKGVLGAAVAFGVLRLAVMGAVVATKVLSAVTSMSPVGLIVRGIALAAGVLIGNWSAVAPYFQALWEKIRGPAVVLWGWMKAAFAWTPLGMIINNWQPLARFFNSLWERVKSLSEPFFSFLKAAFAWSPLGMIINNWQPLGQFFESLWGVIKALSVPFFDFLKAAFAWTPLGMIINNWQPLGQFFGSLWDVIKGLSVPFLGFMKTAFDWSPMGMIVKNWEPISAWFQNLWGKLKPILEPMMKLFGGGSGETVLQAATGKANQFAEQQRQRNAGVGGGTGAFLAANATETTRLNQQRINDATGIPSTSQLLSRPALPAPGSLLQAGAAGGKAQLQGEMVMRFEGAPPGMRVEPAKTNQPGLTVTPSVGYRTIGNGGKP